MTAIHGDEISPVLALASLGERQLVANLKAIRVRKRFVDRDLNASFGLKKGKGYEISRARKILQMIDPESWVVDFHSFSCQSPPFVIITRLEMLDFARTLGLKRIVYMKYNIKQGHALIDYCRGVSVEVGQHEDPRIFSRVERIVKNVRRGQPRKDIVLYKVNGIIQEPGRYRNFQLHPGGFVPILSGEKAYQHYGLKAQIMRS